MAGNPQRQMQDEMERFEAEVLRTSRPSIPSMLRPSTIRPSGSTGSFNHNSNQQQPRLGGPPSTLFLPTQLQRAGAGVRAAAPATSTNFSTTANSTSASGNQASAVGAAVISNKPVLYLPEKKETKPTAAPVVLKAPPPVVNKKPKLETKTPSKLSANSAVVGSGPSVLKAPSSTVGSAAVKTGDAEEPKVPKYKKPKKFVRAAGGTVWQDDSLLEWDPNDYRIFCGDLGNDVTDEVLARVFGKYPSFTKARVIRDRRSNKTKGFGFVSFKDPVDFTRAMKEMNGKYVGSRPIKLRKSNWKNRNIDEVKKRQKEKDALLGKPKKNALTF